VQEAYKLTDSAKELHVKLVIIVLFWCTFCYISDVQVRLVGSSLASRGRVEVLYNGQWGTICDDYWGIAEAHVICRMLNYSGAEFAPRNAFFGEGSAAMPILLDNVKCRGDESTIAGCRHSGWGQNNCDHSDDASVFCWTESTAPVQGTEFSCKNSHYNFFFSCFLFLCYVLSL